MLIESSQPVIIRRLAGDLRLVPGFPVDLPDEEARKLLVKAHGKVRIVAKERIIMEPAKKPNGSPLSPIYWETGDGRILGPAAPEFFLRDGEEYWISVTFEGHIRFIRDDRLRSRKAFLEQREVKEVELIRSF